MTRFKTLSWAIFALFVGAVLTGIDVAPAAAQDDQAYKKTYNEALGAAKAKDYAEARQKFVEASTGAQAAGDAEIARKSKYVAAQLDYKMGTAAMKADKYEEALDHFTSGSALYPDYAKNAYAQGLALKKLDRIDEAMEVWAGLIGNKDAKISKSASDGIRDHYYYVASSAVAKDNAKTEDADAALAALATSEQYVVADADYYYYAALAHSIKGDYEQCIANADKSLEMSNGSKAAKAKMYFIKGEALMYSGDTDGAKLAFQEAAFGNYKELAEHYLETL